MNVENKRGGLMDGGQSTNQEVQRIRKEEARAAEDEEWK